MNFNDKRVKKSSRSYHYDCDCSYGSYYDFAGNGIRSL